ncbi:endo-a1,5-arabinanase [Asticcacaulis biprosthecium C19]|uniref:Endo-a1,5-arabinanase n=1 Tax=Asticcacaulis biprosthecium C19 TaxID=715226 RepID=F4QJF8_9CAUL|nr:glycoside hydrolase family 43 protein [Asticcacaulis biprosthecium]EGF93141.1 endo-a1,5-arabinanase [Asticcacaulis biprosthecium C19]
MLRFLPLFVAFFLVSPQAGAAETFTNPLLDSGPDPWITRDGDTYYYMHTMGNRIVIWKTLDIASLSKAKRKTVWLPPRQGPAAISLWAPELHRIDGKWYLYYTAAEAGFDDDAHRGVFVLENASADPTTGDWVDRGRVNTALAGIDGTTFEYGGQRYFVYSPYVGPDSVLSISRMADPWTLAGGETILARPDLAWERQGGRQILEGPEFLQGPDGQLFLTYSASACWSDDYALGLLSAPAGSDPLNAASWTKSATPVLAKSVSNGIYATGHNGFFTSPDGKTTWIIYHANPGPNMGCTPQRSPRIQPVTWGDDGRPQFAEPQKDGVPIEAP